jgi:hypothetical protein
MADTYVPYRGQQPSDLSVNELNCVPSTEHSKEPQKPSHVPLLHNTSWASQVTGEIEGAESVASSSKLQTMVNSTRQLPMARRGGRRGPLTAEQAQTRRAARLAGICIRCRKTRIKVSNSRDSWGSSIHSPSQCTGGIPCDACRAISTSRIWRTPCTKAQFLDIVESGSYFPREWRVLLAQISC